LCNCDFSLRAGKPWLAEGKKKSGSHLGHLRPEAEVLGVDSSRMKVVGEVAQYYTIAEQLCQVEHFSVVAGNKMLGRQDLTFY